MHALWLENQNITFRNDVPMPLPALGEALIRIRLAGICSTDLELIKGYYPFQGVLGHEFVGIVVDAPGAPHLLNKRVVGEINITCGVCQECYSGRMSHCLNRTVLGIRNHDGVFAEYTILPEKNLHLISDEISDDQAVFTEPLAAALEIQQQVQIRPKDQVLLIGAGRLGQLIARTLALTGCDLWIVVKHQKQKELLHGLSAKLISVQELEQTAYDVVIEATGSPAGFDLARQSVRPCGTIILKSTYHGKTLIDLSQIVVDEVNVVGSRCGPFRPALNLLATGFVNPLDLIEQRFPLSAGKEALEYAASAGVFKVLLYPD